MKRKKKGDLGSLDSLLDTMTSVVGILIIILVVLQLGAKQAVQRIQSDPNLFPSIKEASEKLAQAEEELAALKQDRIRLGAERDQLTARLGGRPTPALKQEKARKAQSLQPTPTNPQLAKELAALKTKNTQLTAASQNMERKLKELEKKLAAQPKTPPKPIARSLRLPDPKEPKAGSRGYRVICTGGKVYPVDYEAWQKRVKEALAQSGLKKNGAGELADSQAAVAHFKKKPIGDAVFTAQPVHSDKSRLLYFRLVPKANTGDLPSNLGKPQSLFQKSLAKLDPKKSHILFTVFPDSFDAYLEARKILGQKGIPAGWSPSGPQPFAWQHHFNTFTNGRSKLPKPKPGKTQSPLARAVLD